QKLVRSLDTTAFAGPVRSVASFMDRDDGAVRVVVTLREDAQDDLEVRGNRLSWRFKGEPVEATIVDEAGRVTRAAADTGTRRYTGTRVSFEFKDIDIHNLLRILAEVSKKNLVVADDVKGTSPSGCATCPGTRPSISSFGPRASARRRRATSSASPRSSGCRPSARPRPRRRKPRRSPSRFSSGSFRSTTRSPARSPPRCRIS